MCTLPENSSLLLDEAIDQFHVEAEEALLRLDRMLVHHYSLSEEREITFHSRTYFQRLIVLSRIWVNGAPARKKGQPLEESDLVEVHFLHLPPPQVQPEDIPLTILYEDEALLVIDKPVGMVVHPAPGHTRGTLVNALLHRYGSSFREVGSSPPDIVRPGIVHRLDKDTSGLLVVAKSSVAQQRLSEQFAKRSVSKRYLAMVVGRPASQRIEAHIGRDPVNRQKMSVRPETEKGVRNAIMWVEPLSRQGELTLVRCDLHTGRTHQIRVHLPHIGSFLLGDPLYGSHKINGRYGVTRPLLHSWQLAFDHPFSHRRLDFTSPLPIDFSTFLETHQFTIPS